MNIKFIGGAGEVTGSCHLLEVCDTKILLDCGMVQGKNVEVGQTFLSFKPDEIDYVILSHAHIDHSGLLPGLVVRGFEGKVFSTVPTRSITKLLLMDSAKIQKEEYKKYNIMPLYDEDDVLTIIKKFRVAEYNKKIDINKDISLTFRDAGHILGSAISEIECGSKITYTGDIGHGKSPILNPPVPVKKTDYLIMESTYGNRTHPQADPKEELHKIISTAYKNGGKVLIPVFAVGRSQEILYLISQLYRDEKRKVPKIPVYLDSPMATNATKLYSGFSNYLRPEFRELFLRGKSPFAFDEFECIQGAGRSIDLAQSHGPCVILAASGMLTGGRVMNHLKSVLENRNSCIVFVGYQAEGTPGREIVDGKKKVVIKTYNGREGEEKIEEIRVKASIHRLDGLSAHADHEGLTGFVNSFKILPSKIFVVHGESDSASYLCNEIIKKFRVNTIVPEEGQKEVLYGKETSKHIHRDFIVDFKPEYVSIGDYKIAPVTGALVEKNGCMHLIRKDELFSILDEQEEEIMKRIPKFEGEEEEGEEKTGDINKINIDEFKKGMKEYHKKEVLSKKRAREFYDILMKEGKDAVISYINFKLMPKHRLYPPDKEIEGKFGNFLVRGFSSLSRDELSGILRKIYD
ncbi:MAG: MBL fold hydrolase [Candidatus Altiarchaeales archaeon HGW-Altiarchaeales-3]|nr:MAG: MBL fold hydrolase [Candidatus Altiarchaeales archaeon HGW-Altiarchaeales-3]